MLLFGADVCRRRQCGSLPRRVAQGIWGLSSLLSSKSCCGWIKCHSIDVVCSLCWHRIAMLVIFHLITLSDRDMNRSMSQHSPRKLTTTVNESIFPLFSEWEASRSCLLKTSLIAKAQVPRLRQLHVHSINRFRVTTHATFGYSSGIRQELFTGALSYGVLPSGIVLLSSFVMPSPGPVFFLSWALWQQLTLVCPAFIESHRSANSNRFLEVSSSVD